MAQKKCDGCTAYNFWMPQDLNDVVFDFQTKLRTIDRKPLNKYQALQIIVREWSQKNNVSVT